MKASMNTAKKQGVWSRAGHLLLDVVEVMVLAVRAIVEPWALQRLKTVRKADELPESNTAVGKSPPPLKPPPLKLAPLPPNSPSGQLLTALKQLGFSASEARQMSLGVSPDLPLEVQVSSALRNRSRAAG